MKSRKNALAQSIKTLLAAPPAPVAPAKPAPKPSPKAPVEEPAMGQLRIRVDQITPNPRQPRKFFDQGKLDDLAASLKRHGVLQPIVVTPGSATGAGYTLLAGERRWRAAQLAGFSEIPAQVIEATDAELLELSIVENVQRDDLNPLEEAEAYRDLMLQFGWTQEEIAERVGKKRPTIANALRLLNLDEEMQQAVRDHSLTPGHARALLSIPDQKLRRRLFLEIVTQGLSVREAERRANAINQPPPKPAQPASMRKKKGSEDIDIDDLRERLVERLGCPVKVRRTSATSGVLEVNWQSLDDLDRVLELLDLKE
ncbi:MAG: ParB/RepB/Spo0J family partition protein [Candidatus Sumerlaeia bacterium]|nr:ParB/RepB/Spo0J family partition protein [Candidatus Sumerlaeia bacterium]